jgi:SHS2 domain-containing protein
MPKSEPTWDYFQHDADIGVVGQGASLERSFEAAAAATFAVMLDPASVGGEQMLTVEFDEPDREIALLRWLNGLLAEARIERLALGCFQIEREGNHWHGTAWGDRWRDDSERGTEVKGATFTMLRVRQVDSAWESQCVIDV